MGDGVLAYFGYPQAHEEDPERAVRRSRPGADRALRARPELDLEVRVGIATGLVVVGDLIGEGVAKAGRSGQHRTSPRGCRSWRVRVRSSSAPRHVA